MLNKLVGKVQKDPIKSIVPVVLAVCTAYYLNEYWVSYVLGGCLSSFVVKVRNSFPFFLAM